GGSEVGSRQALPGRPHPDLVQGGRARHARLPGHEARRRSAGQGRGRRTVRIGAALAAVALAVAVAGCGGGGSSDKTTTTGTAPKLFDYDTSASLGYRDAGVIPNTNPKVQDGSFPSPPGGGRDRHLALPPSQ